MVPGTNRPILVVDDYPEMSRLLRKILLGIGFADVDQARDGSSALAKLRDRPYALIISDLRMTPMSGLELLREVRSDVAFKHIPFIMITAARESDYVVAAREAGVNAYIVKPFTAETVQQKLVGIFGDLRGLSRPSLR